ncbi:hypothetical protein OG352_06135 [Streptomyces sp. NBC_01485]|uniref:hypothetical protein n=1 Tax=Streptomyces sp. NBC_01485 TaxID=2903884 RepID=UPI002E329AEE|nr:hypothetical protein [Streptomyces sp. NBC_01485]
MTDQTIDRREQIRRALAEADGFGFDSLEPHDYQRHADAILALPAVPSAAAPPTQAALLRAADFFRGLHATGTAITPQEAEAELRRMADESAVTPPPALTEEGRLRAQVEMLQQDAARDRGLAKVGARCMREGHQGLIEGGRAVIGGWRFALSTALDLGTGAPWEAIHERVKELAAELAVLPVPVDRAAVLAEAIAAIEAEQEATDVNVAVYPRYDAKERAALGSAMRVLRRLAEAPQPETQDAHVCKPGASTYYCPTSGQTESDCHGGFDVCCDRPELHAPAVVAQPGKENDRG